MVRMAKSAAQNEGVAEQFLEGQFLRIMRMYAAEAESENPATIAAARLQSGQAATIPGDWVDPAVWGGLMLQVRIGTPVAVVGHD